MALKAEELQKIREEVLKQSGLKSTDLDNLVVSAKSGNAKEFAEKLQKLVKESDINKISDLQSSTQTSLSSLVQKITEVVDGVGTNLGQFQTHNREEEQLKADARNRLDLAQVALKEAEAISNIWINNLFGIRRKGIEKAQFELKNAQDWVVEADKRAEQMRNVRIEKADISDNLTTMLAYCNSIIDIFTELEAVNTKQGTELEKARVGVQKSFQQSEKDLKTTRANIEKLEAALTEARETRDSLSGDEIAEQDGAIAQLELDIENLRAQERDLIAIHDSSQSFAAIFLAQIKSLKVTVAVAKALKTALRKKTDARVQSYETAVKQLKLTQAVKVGSDLYKSGDATDEHIMTMTIQMLAMARNDFNQRLQAHPENMRKYKSILEEARKQVDGFKDDVDVYLDDMEKVLEEERSRAHENGLEN